MHYLIDGHNVIGQMPDIDLADPHDEIHLVLKLRAWAAADRRRLVTVVFDGGLPGGASRDLSAGPVQVLFASAGRTADGRLIQLVNGVKNPPEFTLVTGDRRIIDAARARGMPHWPSRRLARELSTPRETTAPPEDEPALSDAEVAEWLELFGPVPERPKKPPRPRARPKPQGRETPVEPRAPRPLTTAKHEDRSLDDDEVAAWLELFGGEAAARRPSESPTEPDKAARPRRRRASRPAKKPVNKRDVSDEDWAAWQDFIGDEPG